MRIEFVYTEDDLLAARRDFAERSPVFRKAKRQGGLLALLLVILLTWASAELLSLPWLYIVGPVGGLLAYGYLLESRYLNKQFVKRSMDHKDEGTFGDCAIEIDPKKLSAFWPKGSLSYDWASLEEIATVPTHTFFYFKGHFVVILSNHSIKSGNYNDFIRQANSYFDSGRDDT